MANWIKNSNCTLAAMAIAIWCIASAHATSQSGCFNPPTGDPAAYELLVHFKPETPPESIEDGLRAFTSIFGFQPDCKGSRSRGICKIRYRARWGTPDVVAPQVFRIIANEKFARLVTNVTVNAPIIVSPGGKLLTEAFAKPADSFGDDLYRLQTELQNLGAELAWVDAKDTEVVKTAVIDSGVELQNPDLQSRIFSGTDIPCASGNCTGEPSDEGGHGTEMAGYIAAEKSSNGVTGVAWNTRVISIAFSENGVSDDDRANAAIRYAADNGARIINASWYSTCELPATKKAIEYAKQKGVLIVVAAGNQGGNIDGLQSATDTVNSYPAKYGSDNLLVVMAHEKRPPYKRSVESNYGATSVDLASPGTGYSTTICFDGNCHTAGGLSSTSAATAYVSGAAALLSSFYPTWTFNELKWRITANVVKEVELKDRNATGGRLSLLQMMRPLVVTSLNLNGEVLRRKGQLIKWETAFSEKMCPLISLDARVDDRPFVAVLEDANTIDGEAPVDLSGLPDGGKVVFRARCESLSSAFSAEYRLAK
jgi:hypothetical protein